MLTRYELIVLSQLAGNRAHDVRQVIEGNKFDRTPDAVKVRLDDERYATELEQLASKLHAMIVEG